MKRLARTCQGGLQLAEVFGAAWIEHGHSSQLAAGRTRRRRWGHCERDGARGLAPRHERVRSAVRQVGLHQQSNQPSIRC